MSEDYITRNEHSKAIDRLHLRIDPINDSSIRMEESSKRMETMVNNMHTLQYGNGKEGLITKVSNLFTKVKANSRVLYIILTSVLGTAGIIIWKTLLG